MKQEDYSLLQDGLELLGIDKKALPKLLLYIESIEEGNVTHSLVSASTTELVTKHVLDSLAPIAEIKELLTQAKGNSIADLGSGAGFPGIPLSLALPNTAIHLIDRMTKRIVFLKKMKEKLELNNVTVIENQVEHLKSAFDIVTFRAFKPFEEKLFKKVFALCKRDGYVIAYKGKIEKAKLELEFIKSLYSDYKIIPIKVPFLNDERCLVVMKPRGK